MPYKDRADTNARRKQRRDDPELYAHDRARQKELWHERRLWMHELKNKPCTRCGELYPPYVMDWHHRNPEEKRFGLSGASLSKSKANLLREIEKCDLYCSNCHRIVEHGNES